MLKLSERPFLLNRDILQINAVLKTVISVSPLYWRYVTSLLTHFLNSENETIDKFTKRGADRLDHSTYIQNKYEISQNLKNNLVYLFSVLLSTG